MYNDVKKGPDLLYRGASCKEGNPQTTEFSWPGTLRCIWRSHGLWEEVSSDAQEQWDVISSKLGQIHLRQRKRTAIDINLARAKKDSQALLEGTHHWGKKIKTRSHQHPPLLLGWRVFQASYREICSIKWGHHLKTQQAVPAASFNAESASSCSARLDPYWRRKAPAWGSLSARHAGHEKKKCRCSTEIM